MTPEQWQKIRPILESALELQSADRAAYLSKACSDAFLRREVESLIAVHERAGTDVLNCAAAPSNLSLMLTGGTRLGDFEILSLLGSGGMGEVYRARDRRLERDVAIKVMPRFVSLEPERLRRFEQEARAAAALNHPNILAVYQLGVHDGAPYLVSELLEGETLREQIKQSRLPVRKAIEYGAQIARGLAAAHAEGIVHRDLKPENLFVTQDERVKILDFGLAKLTGLPDNSEFGASTLTKGTEPGMVLGTVGYMSPEQARGQRSDHHADIFAFGAILYEMLTGDRAFRKATAAETMTAILNEDPPAISQVTPNVPLALQRVVHRCLEKKPEARFQSTSDLAFALEALSDSVIVSTTQTVPTQSSRARMGWIAAVGAALAATAVVSWWMQPAPVPLIEAVKQLTDDGKLKSTTTTIVSDGPRVYFNEIDTEGTTIKEVSASGGQEVAVSTNIGRSALAGMAPDGSALLAFGFNVPGSLWLLPLPAGQARRLGTIVANDAGFFNDGRIVFLNGQALFVAEKDGSNVRKITDFSGGGAWPSVSPDGKRIRFSISAQGLRPSLWEVSVDGTGLHQLLSGWPDASNECCGKWTRDGKYFVFQHQSEGRWDLWALSEQRAWLYRASPQPLRLTNGPLSYVLASPSRNSDQIYAVGSKRRGELVRYDARTRQYLSYAGGPSAIEARVSRDGKWVVYTSYPDHTLWRSRPDGSERLQLTYPPMVILYPQISPDSRKVAFAGLERKRRNLNLYTYVVSIETGGPEEINPGGALTWTPDGNSLVFTALVPGRRLGDDNNMQLYLVDLRTRRVSAFPNSLGLILPFWPEANTLVATQQNSGKMMLYDFKTQKWAELTHSAIGFWAPSPDGRYLYSDEVPDVSGNAQAVRLRLADGKLETVLSLRGTAFSRVVDEQVVPGSLGFNPETWVGVTPDGSLLLTRDVGTQEIYALKARWP